MFGKALGRGARGSWKMLAATTLAWNCQTWQNWDGIGKVIEREHVGQMLGEVGTLLSSQTPANKDCKTGMALPRFQPFQGGLVDARGSEECVEAWKSAKAWRQPPTRPGRGWPLFW